MAYNKAKAEREWRLWKEAEERNLRELGVPEDTISKLHDYDWSIFKSDRRFYEHALWDDTYMSSCNSGPHPFPETADQLLDCINNEALYSFLASMDKLTVQIFLWHTAGYQYHSIAQRTGLSIDAIKNRMWYFRKKMKKFFETF